MCCLHLSCLKLWSPTWRRDEAQEKKKKKEAKKTKTLRSGSKNKSLTRFEVSENSSRETDFSIGQRADIVNKRSSSSEILKCQRKHYAANLLAGHKTNTNNDQNFNEQEDQTNNESHYDALADLIGMEKIALEKTELGQYKYKALEKMSPTRAQESSSGSNSSKGSSNSATCEPSGRPMNEAKEEEQQQQAEERLSLSATKPSQSLPSNASNKLEQDQNNNKHHQEAALFKIRTANGRHLDFDEAFELDNIKAPQRTKWSGPFHFIQAADCQFGMIDSYVHKRTEPGWKEEIELCEKLVKVCNSMQPRPEFLIICGDLIDSLPASQIGQLQALDFKRIFAKLSSNIPLVCVCGNHDVGDEPTETTVQDYRRTFGNDYFYFTKNDILFIVINSQFYQHRENVQKIALEQDQWLEFMLTKCKLFKYSFVFEHIPWFLEDPNEENDYFNIRREVRLTWLEKFKRAGVTKVMCGHYHRNAGGWYDGMELVVTSAIGAQCGNDKSGIRIVKVYEDSIRHQYYAMEDIPLKIEL